MATYRKTTLRDVLFILFRQKAKVVTFFLVVSIATILGSLFTAPVYRSDAKVFFRLGKESMATDSSVTTEVAPIISVGQARDAEILSEIEILSSKELAEKIVDKYGPGAFLYPSEATVEHNAAGDGILTKSVAKIRGSIRSARNYVTSVHKGVAVTDNKELLEKAVTKFSKDLQIEINKKSNIIAVSFEAYDDELAQRSLIDILDAFQDKHISVYRTPGALEFFEEQTEKLRLQVDDDEQKIKDIKLAAGVGSFKEHQDLLMNRIAQLKTDLGTAQDLLSASIAAKDTVLQALNSLPETMSLTETSGVSNPAAEVMRERLLELRVQEESLLNKYKEGTPPVEEVRKQIEEAEASLKREKHSLTENTTGVNSVRQEMQLRVYEESAKVTSQQARVKTLEEQLAKVDKELQECIVTGVEISRLERDLQLHKTNYAKYSDRMEQARINDAQQMARMSNISMVQSPTMPVKPVRPKRLLEIALGIMFAFFGGLALAFIAEYLDSSFKKPEDVEDDLNLPVFASIPFIPSAALKRSAILPEEDSSVGWRLPRPVLGCFKTLRDNLLSTLPNDGKESAFLICGCTGGEGTTSIAVDLAFMLTHGGSEKVLLVDTNLRDPNLPPIFGIKETVGLMNLLTDYTDDPSTDRGSLGIVSTGVPGLDLLPLGSSHEDLSYMTEARLYESDAFASLFSQWRQNYRYILFDAAPASVNTSTLYLAKQVDRVLWILEAEKTRQPVAFNLKEQFSNSGAAVWGVIFNKRKFHIPHWLYYIV